MRCWPSLPEPAVPPDVAGRGTWCRTPTALPVTDEDRQMVGGVSKSMAVVMPVGSPKTGGLLLTACTKATSVSNLDAFTLNDEQGPSATHIVIMCHQHLKTRVRTTFKPCKTLAASQQSTVSSPKSPELQAKAFRPWHHAHGTHVGQDATVSHS